MHQADRKRLVAKEISAFKKLKEQIESHRKATVPVGATSATGGAAEAAAAMGNGAFQAAMAELEARFNARIEEMKGQIQSLRKELDRLRKG
jgi:ferritin-like metal-binding protein YciE